MNADNKLPKQCSVDEPGRVASAPYNFVPLPDKVVKVYDNISEIPSHATSSSDLLSGYFDVTIRTLTPLYIRCGYSKSKLGNVDETRPEFFSTTSANEPVIPGSSLRGMLRNLVRIISFSKMEGFNDKKMFFRSMDSSSLRRYYSSRMQSSINEPNVQTGFMIKKSDIYQIRPCKMLRVSIELLKEKFSKQLYDDNRPNWEVQYQTVWVKADSSGKYVEFLQCTKEAGYSEGIVVLSGPINGKKKEFVFLLPDDQQPAGSGLVVDEKLIDEQFHDKDQISQWQEKAFHMNMPTPASRAKDGWLPKLMDLENKKQPIFYLIENGKVSAFGRAFMFRLPYADTVKDFVPLQNRDPGYIDYVEAIFGFAKDSDSSYAGRVFIGDARLKNKHEKDFWLSQESLTPKALSSPKPTAFQHYLVQVPESVEKNKLLHYGNKGKTVIRGFKQYWHQGEIASKSIEADPAKVKKSPSQYTRIRPLKAGVEFVFRIHFHNLTKKELGALCWALHPRGPKGHDFRHKLGMGKPLGMGSVQLCAVLHLLDSKLRYKRLFSGDNWEKGCGAEALELSNYQKLADLTREFEGDLLGQLKDLSILDESSPKKLNNLYEIERIECLLKMMAWPGQTPVESEGKYLSKQNRPNTRYMRIDGNNEYRDRPVLPDPLEGFGRLKCAVVAEKPPPATSMELAFAGHAGRSPAESTATTSKQEIVTLLSGPNKKNVAQVQPEEGEPIQCIKCGNPYGKEPGYRFKAIVTRENGVATQCEFKSW